MIKNWNDFINESMYSCDGCGGSGEVDCLYCKNGIIYCSECDGDGVLDDEDCYVCYGQGQEDCNDCNGDGNVNCEQCDGSGEIEEYDEDEFEEYDEDNDVDLSLELEYKIRTLDDDSQYDFDEFFEEFGVKNPNDFAIAAILNGKEKYKDMSDDEFFELYKNIKEND